MIVAYEYAAEKRCLFTLTVGDPVDLLTTRVQAVSAKPIIIVEIAHPTEVLTLIRFRTEHVRQNGEYAAIICRSDYKPRGSTNTQAQNKR